MENISVKELATAVKEDRLEFGDALLMHLERHHPEHHGIEAFFVLSMALGYANMGRPETTLKLAGEEATAIEWVQRLELEPFVE